MRPFPPLSRGVINVSIEKTDQNTENQEISCQEDKSIRYLGVSSFENITLHAEIPNKVIAGEVLNISGNTTSNATTVTAFLVDKNKNQFSFPVTVKEGAFQVSIPFPETGIYQLGIVPGNNGSSFVHQITVIGGNCLTENTDENQSEISNFKIKKEEGETILSWEKNSYNAFKIAFRQNDQEVIYFLKDIQSLKPIYKNFDLFSEGKVDIDIQGASLTEKSFLENEEVKWSKAKTASIQITEHQPYDIDKDSVTVSTLPNKIVANQNISLKFKSSANINSKAAIILPDGSVEKVALESQSEPVKKSK